MDFYLVDETTTLEQGSYGIREPKLEPAKQFVPNAQDEIFIVMPGAVFDEAGNRIGYGGGYYDKYLEKIFGAYGYCPYLIGLAFACQISPKKIPLEEHDKKMDCILTERRVIMPKEENQGKLGAIADVVELVIEVAIELIAELVD